MPDLKNVMPPQELVVCETYPLEDRHHYASVPGSLLIACRYPENSAQWPTEYKHLGRVYLFASQEPLGDLEGTFAVLSCAKYVLRKEYECYLMDTSLKMAHIPSKPMFASENLGDCCEFIYKQYQKDGVAIGVYQPRTNSYRDYYGLQEDPEASSPTKPLKVTMVVESRYGEADLFANISGPGVTPYTGTVGTCLEICKQKNYVIENAQEVLFAINEKGEFSSRS